MSDTPVLSRTKDHRHLPLLESMRRARAESGKGFAAQACEMLALHRGFGRLSPEEYYAYNLHDDARFDRAAKRRFLGIEGERIVDRICNPEMRWRAVVRDKIVFAAMMTGLGFPVPSLIAFVHPKRRSFMGRDLRDRAELLAFLENLDRPAFGKPVDSRWSLGSASLEGRREDGRLVLLGGSTVAAGDLADQVMGFAADGYLFQERLAPHPAIAAACGPAIGSLRLLTGMTPEGPVLLDTAWKIVGGGNVADNFWRAGNLLAAIDAHDGRIVRVASGLADESRTHDVHPDTGAPLVGFVLPHWEEAVALCKAAATSLAGLRLIGWDVAITADGPVIVEANTLPAFNLHQIARGEGIHDGAFAAFVAACRKAPRVPGSAGRGR